MPVVHAVLGFSLLAGLLTIIPGVDTALVARSAISRSTGCAVATAIGIQTGTMVWGAAAAVGASTLLAASKTGYLILALAGACYLIWMGATLLRSGFRRQPGELRDSVHLSIDGRGSLLTGWARGVATNLLNPKVGVFYLATVPQFVPIGISPLSMGLLLAAVHCVMGMSWSLLVIIIASRLSGALQSDQFERWTDRVAGGALVAFGAVMLAESNVFG